MSYALNKEVCLYRRTTNINTRLLELARQPTSKAVIPPSELDGQQTKQ